MIAEAGKATATNAGVFVLASCSRLTKEHETVDRSKKGCLRAEMKAENRIGQKFLIGNIWLVKRSSDRRVNW